MKITPLAAATAAVLVTLGACSAPVGLDSTTAAPSLELSNTLSATGTFLIGFDSTGVIPIVTTCTTSTTTTTTSTTTSTTSPTATTSQVSASGTYAVAYTGPTTTSSCPAP